MLEGLRGIVLEIQMLGTIASLVAASTAAIRGLRVKVRRPRPVPAGSPREPGECRHGKMLAAVVRVL
jgi:hypothetical protein